MTDLLIKWLTKKLKLDSLRAFVENNEAQNENLGKGFRATEQDLRKDIGRTNDRIDYVSERLDSAEEANRNNGHEIHKLEVLQGTMRDDFTYKTDEHSKQLIEVFNEIGKLKERKEFESRIENKELKRDKKKMAKYTGTLKPTGDGYYEGTFYKWMPEKEKSGLIICYGILAHHSDWITVFYKFYPDTNILEIKDDKIAGGAYVTRFKVYDALTAERFVTSHVEANNILIVDDYKNV